MISIVIIGIDNPRAVLHCVGRALQQLQQLRVGFHGDFEEKWWDLLGDSGQLANTKKLH